MSKESSARIDRIKAILGLEEDQELAAVCGCHNPRISNWRHKGFPVSTERLLDALMDQYDQDKRPPRGRPPKMSDGQRIRKVRLKCRLSQRALGLRMYGEEGISANACQLRIKRLETEDRVDDETLKKAAAALGVSKEAF